MGGCPAIQGSLHCQPTPLQYEIPPDIWSWFVRRAGDQAWTGLGHMSRQKCLEKGLFRLAVSVALTLLPSTTLAAYVLEKVRYHHQTFFTLIFTTFSY